MNMLKYTNKLKYSHYTRRKHNSLEREAYRAHYLVNGKEVD